MVRRSIGRGCSQAERPPPPPARPSASDGKGAADRHAASQTDRSGADLGPADASVLTYCIDRANAASDEGAWSNLCKRAATPYKEGPRRTSFH
jgi:hypothetical protein